jgi:cytochrome P450
MAHGGSNGKLPPGPSSPALVQSLRYYRDPYGFLRACHAKYGDWFTVKQIPCGTIVYVADPDAVRELFADPTLLVAPVNAYMAPVLGAGLFLLDGEAHIRERRWLAPAFARDRLGALVKDVEAVANEEISTWQIGRAFALLPRLEALALSLILRVLFGDGAAARTARIAPLILKLKSKDLLHSVLAALPFGFDRWRLSDAAVRTLAAVDAEIEGELAERRAGTATNGGILASMLAPCDGHVASDRAIRDEVMTFVFAGHDTVATTLAWAVERIVRHPDAAASLARGDDRYVEAVLLETMRQRSVIADVGRELREPVSLGGRHFLAGTRLCPSVTLIHMRADRFPDPETFRPERFLDGARPEPWLYMPFGGGVRRCIGETFAMTEMRTILAAIVARTQLRPSHRAPERGVSNGVTIAPHRGAEVVLEAWR